MLVRQKLWQAIRSSGPASRSERNAFLPSPACLKEAREEMARGFVPGRAAAWAGQLPGVRGGSSGLDQASLGKRGGSARKAEGSLRKVRPSLGKAHGSRRKRAPSPCPRGVTSAEEAPFRREDRRILRETPRIRPSETGRDCAPAPAPPELGGERGWTVIALPPGGRGGLPLRRRSTTLAHSEIPLVR